MSVFSMLLGGLLGNWISTAGTPNALIQSVNILFNRLFRITPLPLEVAIYLYQSGRITEEQYKSILADWGYDELAADILYTVLQRRPSINELVRGLFYLYAEPHNINNVWQSIETYLRDYGYTEEQARVITASMKYLPSLSDVLSWMAKEAFEEDMVRILGLDDEFPEKFAEYAAKIGIPYEDALRYWRAHWSTPGWSQVAEAFHRARGNAYIDNTYEHTMSEWDRIWDVYYRQAEVPRFWRQLLTSITYNVITRVDARRMYEMGFINKKELAAIYMKLGYTKEDAELMADWVAWEVQRYDEEDLRGLTKSHVDKLYKLGLISDSEYVDLLQKVGYGKETAHYYLSIMQAELFTDTMDRKIDTIKRRYIRGIITKDEAYKNLLDLGIDAEISGNLLASWEPDVITAKKDLSKDDIRQAIRYQIIPLNEGYKRLIAQGYSPEDAKILLRIWGARREDVEKLA